MTRVGAFRRAFGGRCGPSGPCGPCGRLGPPGLLLMLLLQGGCASWPAAGPAPTASSRGPTLVRLASVEPVGAAAAAAAAPAAASTSTAAPASPAAAAPSPVPAPASSVVGNPSATEPDRAKASPALAPSPGPAASGSAPLPVAVPAEAPARPARVPTVRIEAPSALRAVLDDYLDLTRATRLADAASIRDSEWNRLVAAAPAQARALVQTEGYFDAKARVVREDGTPPVVRLLLEPGEPARVGRLTFEIQGDLADAAAQGDAEASTLAGRLRAEWPLQPDDAFRNSAWSEAKNAVLARLRAQGYATASWTGTGAEVDLDTRRVRLFMVVDSGPLFRAGPIEVEGLEHHEAERVRALAGFGPGTPLTEARLLDYQERLVKTGLFDQAAVTLDADPARAEQARVRVLLKESRLQAATVAVGISANSGPRTTLEHSHRRLFGWPATTRNKFEWGRDRQAWDGEISTHPDADLHRYLLGGSVERLVTDLDVVLSQRLRLGRATETSERDRLWFVEGERAHECSRLFKQTCSDLQALTLNQHTTWRQVDSVLLPTRGYTLNLQLGAGAASGSRTDNGPFARLYGRATGYWPLGRSWYTQGRIELGALISQDRVVAPDSQRFRAGGDESVRGYPWRSLAPLNADGSTTGGKVLFTGSAELARPVSASLPSVWWAVFADVGRAADDWSALDPAWGYGAGVRWRSPVGPLKLDLAWGQEVQKFRLHLTVGIAF